MFALTSTWMCTCIRGASSAELQGLEQSGFPHFPGILIIGGKWRTWVFPQVSGFSHSSSMTGASHVLSPHSSHSLHCFILYGHMLHSIQSVTIKLLFLCEIDGQRVWRAKPIEKQKRKIPTWMWRGWALDFTLDSILLNKMLGGLGDFLLFCWWRRKFQRNWSSIYGR